MWTKNCAMSVWVWVHPAGRCICATPLANVAVMVMVHESMVIVKEAHEAVRAEAQHGGNSGGEGCMRI
jgi:hypothetical protein